MILRSFPLWQIALVVAACALPATTVSAEDNAIHPRELTLLEAIAFAREHHPLLAEAAARVRGREADADIPRGQWYPRIVAATQFWVSTMNNSTTMLVAGGTGVDLPRVGAVPTGTRDLSYAEASTLAAIGLRQQIYDFGRFTNQTESELALGVAERRDAQAIQLDVELGVKQAYFSVQAARTLRDSARDAVRRAVKYRDLTDEAVRGGRRPAVDVTLEEAELARVEAELENAEGSLMLAQAELAAAIGSSEERLDATAFADVDLDIPKPETADTLLASEPRLLASRARLRAQQAKSAALFSERLPALWLSATVSAREGGAVSTSGDRPRNNGFFPSVPNWDVGVVLTWTLFDQVASARVRSAEASEHVLAAKLEVETEAHRARLRRAANELGVAHRALGPLSRAVEKAQEGLRQTDARYRTGEAVTADLRRAEKLLADAQDRLVLGRLRWARARAAHERVVAGHLETRYAGGPS